MFTFASRGRSARSRARQAQRLCKAPRIVSNFGAYVVASCLATSVSYAALVGMARLEALHAQDAGGAPAENAAPSNDAPSDVLPEVTVETSPAPAPTPKPVAPKKNTEAYVEDDEPAPRPAKKAAKKVAQPKPAAPPPESYDDAPPESADADPSANGEGVVVGITPAQPNAIDGYVATRTSTATKTNTPLRDVPQSISVVSRQQAEDQNSKDVYKALQYVPGVVMGQGEGHRDAPTIRGQSTTADFFVNGVRDDVQYFRDLYNVSSLEVLKGPTAMVFGRGGGGGVINRVTKQADGETVREVTVTAGSFDTKRTTVDVGGAITGASAVRLNAMYEDSGSFRDFVELERYGINPTMSFRPSDQTRVSLSYEFFSDDRVVDRGIPSRDGRPSSAPIEQFFGNPRASFMDFTSHVGTATVEHMTDVGIKIRNVTSYGDYDKFYQNVFASSAVSDAGTVNIAAYNNALVRQNFFNQTDVTGEIKLGNGLKHTWLVGTEIGYQETDSFRFDANFNSADGPGSIAVPFGSGVTYAPMFFNRLQNNARNHTELGLAGVYVQDQLSIGRYIDVIGGIRFDHFNLDYTNEVDGSERGRIDNTFSPRAGIVLKPLEAVSVYASYSESFLPFSGDQFTALSAANADLSPEKFTNHEIGVKWDILPRLAFTAALFKLDRENTTAAGPIAGTLVQTGATETKGLELALTGYVTDDWQVSAGFAHTRAEIASTTTAAPAGRDVPLVPDNTFSLWNRYQLTRMFGVGVGVVHRTEMFTSISNTVELPSFTRVDAALFVNLTDNLKAQINVENLLDETYYTTAHNDNNITPGSPRAFFVTVTSNF